MRVTISESPLRRKSRSARNFSRPAVLVTTSLSPSARWAPKEEKKINWDSEGAPIDGVSACAKTSLTRASTAAAKDRSLWSGIGCAPATMISRAVRYPRHRRSTADVTFDSTQWHSAVQVVADWTSALDA
jgi:hypothetical protein